MISQGEQIIVEGKGIGFHKMPCEITDLSEVKRTYYNTKEQYIDLIHEVPETVLEVCEKIFELASRMIGDKINPNLTFILADHIQFSIERYEKNIDMKMPLYYDIEYLYPKSVIKKKSIYITRSFLFLFFPYISPTFIIFAIT